MPLRTLANTEALDSLFSDSTPDTESAVRKLEDLAAANRKVIAVSKFPKLGILQAAGSKSAGSAALHDS